MADEIPNPYKAAVEAAEHEAMPHARDFQGMLDQAVGSMEGGAWISTSSAARSFGTGLSQQRSRLNGIDEAVADAFDDVLAGQPDEVEPGSWQTRWHNL